MARNDTYFNRMQTLIDPYRVEAEDQDNLLGVYDNVAPMAGNAPSAVSQLEAFTPPPRPAPEPSIGQGTGSYVEDAVKPTTQAEIAEMYATGYPMKDVQARINRSNELSQKIIDEGGGETASRLQSTAPDWYESKKPPASHGGWADAAQMLGGALAAGPNQALKDPRRPMDMKAQDARKVALAGGLSTLLSNLFTRGQTDFKANQDAAVKESQMTKTIPGTKTRAQLEFDANSKYIDQAQRARMQDSLAGHRSFQEGQTTAELDPNDSQAIAIRKTLIAAGVPEEEVRDLGRKALQLRAATINTGLAAGHTAGQKVADTANKRAEIILEADVKRNQSIDEDIRKAEQERGRAFVPGVNWVNNTPPPPHTVEETRQLYKDTAGFKDRLDRMRQIQPRIVAAAQKYAREHGLGEDVGKALAMMGPINQWTEAMGPEAHALANEASVLQTSIQNFIRSPSYSNLGVMQKWEDLKTKLMVPMAGSASGFLRGDALWSSLANDVDRMWKDGVRAYGGFLDGEQGPAAPVGARTPEQQRDATPTRAPAPIAQYNPRTRQVETQPEAPVDLAAGPAPAPIPGATPPGPADQAKLDAAKGRAGAPAPAPQAAPTPQPKLEAGQKMFKVTRKNGKVEEKPMDPKVAAALVKDHPEIIASVEEM